ncbi:sarcosine oxidase [Halomonas sp. TBZ9]|uniref:Sarcosine oxidase n=1 Tax=Vreelandella azerica TaxID=2732867 RepID=A0A7Y3XBG1_9GAMM|nr:sarcosine oxidase [Halomonas azerica]NOG32236.1 sarcosine oxidase [Halomonas azerica]
MATLQEALAPKRTPLYHLHQARSGNDHWQPLNGYAVEGAPDDSKEANVARLTQCSLSDLSALARLGVRGQKAAGFLTQHGYQLPSAPNQAVKQPDGSLVARLSASEYLLLGSLADAGQRISQHETQWPSHQSGVYCLPRQDTHAWLALSGPHISAVMAKLCGVDMRPNVFAPGQVAQTAVARANAIVINAGACFYLLVDTALACYFWSVMLDAMQEFDGQPLSVTALQHALES